EYPDIAPGSILDDRIIEVDENCEFTWEWRSGEHFHNLGLDEAARNIIFRGSSIERDYDGLHSPMHRKDPYDWLHSNSASYVGPNKWYDEGDDRFHPGNIIWDSRDTNTIGIISRETGEFTWKIGPDYTRPELKDLGQIIGQHHAHVIPRGLPGEGNVLVFDNGGFAGYGPPNPGAPTGEYNAVRPYSRVLEFNPITLELVWEYSARTAGYGYHHHDVFYSPFISSAQRLPNGNTLICEGDRARIFETNTEHEIVWEYIVPPEPGSNGTVTCYRAYRLPYDWVPQAETPDEKPVVPPDRSEFHIEPSE
ncbi:MAG: aryl-sulfate sulfotransferase, partial [Planctomycetes bacterium]|nr:aryl-sulfate sulfotransferase [Planctomycetota bacterium]